MARQLIQLQEGILVEAELFDEQAREISGGALKKVKASLDQIHSLLLTVCRPITNTWKELNKEASIDRAEVELALRFEGVGNLYLAKAKAGASVTVKLVISPDGTFQRRT